MLWFWSCSWYYQLLCLYPCLVSRLETWRHSYHLGFLCRVNPFLANDHSDQEWEKCMQRMASKISKQKEKECVVWKENIVKKSGQEVSGYKKGKMKKYTVQEEYDDNNNNIKTSTHLWLEDQKTSCPLVVEGYSCFWRQRRLEQGLLRYQPES